MDVRRGLVAMVGLGVAALGSGCHATTPPALALQASDAAVTIDKPGLYPETVVYDAQQQRFLVGSFREGAIYAIHASGKATRFVDDPRLTSVLGMALDTARGRVWAVDADLGVGLKQSAAGPKAEAAVATYDLASGRALSWLDLGSLRPGPHLLNGIALDAAGSAYITDSFAQCIYRVTAAGESSVFLTSDHFAGAGVNLNGLVVHPDGFLLVVKKSDGALFRVPLSAPSKFTKVALQRPIIGADGLVLTSSGELVVIANQTPATATNAAIVLKTDDGWASAKTGAIQPLGEVYPTTAALRDGELVLLYSNLNELLQSSAEQRPSLVRSAKLRTIGTLRQ